MCSSIRGILRFNSGLFINNVNRRIILNECCHTLYTESSLGLPEYKESRANYQDRYRNSLTTFRDKIRISLSDEHSLIFTEDLKALLHIVDKNPEDVNLLKSALERFNDQNRDIRFGTFKFGPVVMRTFHYLNEPIVALETFKNQKLQNFYDQHTTFTILVDLLYNNGMYAEVRHVYDCIKSNFSNGVQCPQMVISVLAAACYKENTQENLDFVIKLCKEITERGATPMRKVIALFAALALNQNAPHVALELLAVCKKTDYISIRTIRCMALCDLNRLDDVVQDFQFALKRGIPQKNNYFADIIPKIDAAIQRLDIQPDAEIYELRDLMKARNYIESKTLDDHLSEAQEAIKFSDQRYQNLNRQKYRQKDYTGSGWSQSKRRNE